MSRIRAFRWNKDPAPDNPATALPGRPPVVDLATWQAARDELLVREKAHTREGDAIAAARHRLPMVEFDPSVAPYVEFMGYTQPWYSVRDLAEPVGGDTGHLTCYLRDGDRAFLTYSTTGRGNERVMGAFGLLDH
jgi:predicted dithiol-disulfide oxidoreductase (DUF899 family)